MHIIKNISFNFIKILLCISIVCGSIATYADDMEQQFVQGNELYSEGKYAEAISVYNDILKTDYQSAALHYNLGNAHYKQGKIGAAVLHYEKAAVLSPYDGDIQFNLKIARQHTIDNISELKPFFLARWWGNLRDVFSSNTWCILGMLLFWLGIGGLITWLMASTRALKKRGFLVGTSLVILSLFVLVVAWEKAGIETDSGFAIIYTAETALKNAPDEQSSDILQLHEGTKIEILDQIGEWYKVRLMNGEQGWMPAATVEKI